MDEIYNDKYFQIQELASKREEKSPGQPNSIKSALELIHINAFNTLPMFALATILLGELGPVVESDAIRGTFEPYHTYIHFI